MFAIEVSEAGMVRYPLGWDAAAPAAFWLGACWFLTVRRGNARRIDKDERRLARLPSLFIKLYYLVPKA